MHTCVLSYIYYLQMIELIESLIPCILAFSYSHFRVLSPNCTLHTAIIGFISVSEQWSLCNVQLGLKTLKCLYDFPVHDTEAQQHLLWHDLL